MEKNVGNLDKLVRVVIGLALIAMVFVGPQSPWGWIGVIPLATAAMSWCPLYTVVGIKTCPHAPTPKM